MTEDIADIKDDTGMRFSVSELRKAGASWQFINVYFYERPGRKSTVVRELENGFGGTLLEEKLAEGEPEEYNPPGGHFFTALWEGRMSDALARADSRNRAILNDCGWDTETLNR